MAIDVRNDGLGGRAVRGRISECDHVRLVNEEPHRHRRSHGGNGRTGLVQNLFHKNKESRTISLSSQYIVVFKNPRDASQMSHLARQMYPGRVEFVQEAFKEGTSVPYGYLLVDLKQDTPEDMRLRTTIFPDDGVQYMYLPKV